jgi:hypothetical protein
MNKSKFINLFYILIYFSSLIFILYKFYQNKDFIYDNFKDGYYYLFFTVVLFIIFHNFIALKFYIFLKIYSKIKLKLNNWMFIYFSGATFNLVVLMSGSFFKAKKLKDLSFSYSHYLTLSYFNYFVHLLVFFTLLFFTLLFFKITHWILYTIIIFYFLILILIFYSPNLTIFVLKKLNSYFKINFFLKLINIVEMLKQVFNNKKLIKISLILNLINYVFRIILFYIVCIHLIEIKIEQFIILWSSKLILDKFLLMKSFSYLNDFLIALFSSFLGNNFDISLIIQVVDRICLSISSVSNLLIYKLIKTMKSHS